MNEEQARGGEVPDIDALGFEEIEADLKNVGEAIPVAKPVTNAKPIAKKFASKPSKVIGKAATAVSVEDIQNSSKPRKSKLPYVIVAALLLGGAGAFSYFQYFRKANSQLATGVASGQGEKPTVNDTGDLYSAVQKKYDEIKSAKGIADEEIVKRANEAIALVNQVKDKYSAIFDKCDEYEQGQIRSKLTTLASIEGFFRGAIIKVNSKNKKIEAPKQESQVSEAPPPQAEKKDEKPASNGVIEQPQQQKNIEEAKPQEQPPGKPAEETPPQMAVEEKKEEQPAQSTPRKEMSEEDIIKEADTTIGEVVTGVKKLKPNYTNIPKDSEAITLLLNSTMNLIKGLDKSRDMLNQIRQKHHNEPSYSYMDEKLKHIDVIRNYLIKQSEKLMAQLK